MGGRRARGAGLREERVGERMPRVGRRGARRGGREEGGIWALNRRGARADAVTFIRDERCTRRHNSDASIDSPSRGDTDPKKYRGVKIKYRW